ncbi:hypothetical protein [Spirosoma panaciterrae]|nr:hypothetical protein [Spirosoma panaciterrae]
MKRDYFGALLLSHRQESSRLTRFEPATTRLSVDETLFYGTR